ncbi:4330_t:CDS:1, partial [Cetraspora pellucida]
LINCYDNNINNTSSVFQIISKIINPMKVFVKPRVFTTSSNELTKNSEDKEIRPIFHHL